MICSAILKVQHCSGFSRTFSAELSLSVAVHQVVLQSNQTVNDGVAHSKNPRKCAYHVTSDLDLDLQHILDAR